jgi:hypothetical protein
VFLKQTREEERRKGIHLNAYAYERVQEMVMKDCVGASGSSGELGDKTADHAVILQTSEQKRLSN